MGYVYVSVNDREESLFARSPQGSRAANWIQPGSTYQFRLYNHSEGSTAESTNSRSYTGSFASVKITARRDDSKPSRNEWGWGS